MIPKILKNFNLFIDGEGFTGLCEEAEIPAVKIKMENYRGGGMDAEYEVDMGMDAMSSKLTMGEHLPQVITALGNGKTIQLRGALVRDSDGATSALVVELGARGKAFTGGNLKAGDKNTPEHEFAVDYFRLNIDGTDLIEIDVVNMTRVINGVDQLAAMRAALNI